MLPVAGHLSGIACYCVQPSFASQPSIACRHQCQTSGRPVTPLLLDHTATRQQYLRSTPLPVVTPRGIRSLPRPRTACELGTSEGSPSSPTPKSFLSCHESRPRSTQRNVVVGLVLLLPHGTYRTSRAAIVDQIMFECLPPTGLLLADVVPTRHRPTVDPVFDDRRMQDIKE